MRLSSKLRERQKQFSSLLENYETRESVKSWQDNDVYCRLLLNNLFDGYEHLPVTKSSMSFFAIAMITNDVIINGRKVVLEFGSGLSTILLARLLKKNNISCTVYSVEHDKNWYDLLNKILKKDNSLDNIVPIYAPLIADTAATTEWYDEGIINNKLPENVLFDMVIIDGPPAHEKSRSESRYPALPFVQSRLNKIFSIYLDDASRPGEQAVLKRWEKETGFKFNLVGNRLALSSNDDLLQYTCLPC